jgi:biopolymer transport protein ExbD
MRFKRTKKIEARIPTASMADIAFLLIVFFMVTTVHEVDRTSVNLPLAKIREEAEKGSAFVVLGKMKSGDTEQLIYKFSDGEAMSKVISGPEDIYLEASRLTFRDPNQQFILKADGTVHFEKIDELLDAMRKGGVAKVLLLTQQKTAKGEGS